MSPSPSTRPDRRRTYEVNRYPAALIDVWRPDAGARFTFRPILPQDEVLLGQMYARLSRESIYNRFHSPMNGLSPATLRRMASVDYRRELACVVTTPWAGREIVVADVRYVVDEDGADGEAGTAEFAIVVDEPWQCRGLGERAIRALGDAARRAGLRRLHGSVLRANAPMLSLMRRCGFACRPDPEEGRLVQVEKDLHDTGDARPEGTPPRRMLDLLFSVGFLETR